MNQRATLTIRGQENGVRLPDDFKELAQKDPVYTIDPDGVTLYAADVMSRADCIKLYNTNTFYASGRQVPVAAKGIPLYLDFEDYVPFLKSYFKVGSDLQIQLNYFAYPPKLEKDSDDNYLTREYPQMIVDYAKYLIFKQVNDEAASAMAFKTAQDEFSRASKSDVYRNISGVRNLM